MEFEEAVAMRNSDFTFKVSKERKKKHRMPSADEKKELHTWYNL
jgi:hypothetical protein